MSKLQSCIKHSEDCSCYQVIFDKYGAVHDCDICDCGALRNVMRKMGCSDLPEKSDIFNCWLLHVAAISRT